MRCTNPALPVEPAESLSLAIKGRQRPDGLTLLRNKQKESRESIGFAALFLSLVTNLRYIAVSSVISLQL